MIVLPMAGLSSRFFNAGYKMPKYMLDLRGRSVFRHALESFNHFFADETFLIICRKDYDTPSFILQECEKAGVPMHNLKIVTLETATQGQAETVALGLQKADCARAEPLTIFNIDTFRPDFRHPTAFDTDRIDGYVEVFQGEGEHWSFVLPDLSKPHEFRALEVAEKLRISDLCSTGLYYFSSVGMFMDLYSQVADKDVHELQGGERYVAPLYNIAIKQGQDIRYTIVGKEEVQFCGAPSEYESLR